MNARSSVIQDALKIGMTKTRTFYLLVPENNVQGIEIGKGACKGVIIRLNKYKNNTDDASAVLYVYYGDSTAQQYELEQGKESQLILCTDLSQIYVRTPSGLWGGETAEISVLVYE